MRFKTERTACFRTTPNEIFPTPPSSGVALFLSRGSRSRGCVILSCVVYGSSERDKRGRFLGFAGGKPEPLDWMPAQQWCRLRSGPLAPLPVTVCLGDTPSACTEGGDSCPPSGGGLICFSCGWGATRPCCASCVSGWFVRRRGVRYVDTRNFEIGNTCATRREFPPFSFHFPRCPVDIARVL